MLLPSPFSATSLAARIFVTRSWWNGLHLPACDGTCPAIATFFGAPAESSGAGRLRSEVGSVPSRFSNVTTSATRGSSSQNHVYPVTGPDPPMYEVGTVCCEILRGCPLIGRLLLRGS